MGDEIGDQAQCFRHYEKTDDPKLMADYFSLNRGDKMILWIWLLLTLIFIYFAFAYWRYSSAPLRTFVSRRSAGLESEEVAPEIDGMERELQEFKGYLESMNRSIQFRFRVGAIGFLIAAGSAILGIIYY